MKIIYFSHRNNMTYGVIDDDDNIFLIEGSIYDTFTIGKKLGKLSDVKLLAPCEPRIVIGVGLNYPSHVEQSSVKVTSREPLLFFKPATSVIGHLENIVYPKISSNVNCAGELAVVMKRRASHVTKDIALDYVLGYTCANDIEAVDIFKKDPLPTRAKSFDTFCPLGPWIATGIDGNNLNLKAKLNGVLMQESSSREMIFNIENLISFVTEFMTLQPGDVIITGSSRILIDNTLHAGDIVEVDIEKIGTLKNRVV